MEMFIFYWVLFNVLNEKTIIIYQKFKLHVVLQSWYKIKILISSLVIPVHYSVYASFQFGSHIEVIMPCSQKINVRRNPLKKIETLLFTCTHDLGCIVFKYTSGVEVNVIEVSHAEL